MKYFKKLIGERIYLSPKGTSEEEKSDLPVHFS